MKSSMLHRTFLSFAVVFLFFLMSDGKATPSDPPVGSWTKSLNERTVTFAINADQTYTVEFVGDEAIDVKGSYVISGNQITFKDESGDYSSDEPGVYEFQLGESAVEFTPVDDPVYGRSVLVTGTWSKAKDY